MKALLPLVIKKKGLSNIVAYVLLISITISLSVMVYGWLRFYVDPVEIDECSDNVNIIIRSYDCSLPNATGYGGRITVTLKNKGLFTVDGYELRVHNREGADFGFYLFNDTGTEIAPGAEETYTYYFDQYNFTLDEIGENDDHLKDVKLVEVQPFVFKEGTNEVRCRSLASQAVECLA